MVGDAGQADVAMLVSGPVQGQSRARAFGVGDYGPKGHGTS